MLNKICYQGRLVADPELKKTSGDVAYCSFTVAWSEKYKETETKCFLRCKAWRGTADFIGKYFVKGQQIAIEGHLTTEEWEKDGQKRSATVCVLDKAHFCGDKKETAEPESVPLDDIPF